MASVRSFLNILESLFNYAVIELSVSGCIEPLFLIIEAIETLFLYLTVRVEALQVMFIQYPANGLGCGSFKW